MIATDLRNQLTPDENALDLYRRLEEKPVFHVRLSPDPAGVEQLQFTDCAEVIASVEEMSEFVLSCALDFAHQFEDGVIFHVSTGNNLYQSLLQSGIDISNTSLKKLHDAGKIKCHTVHNIIQLFAVSELIRISLRSEKILLLLEGLGILFLAQKGLNGSIPPTSLISSTLKSITQLSQYYQVACLWVNSAQQRMSGGHNNRDQFTILWKKKIPKVLYYHAGGQ